MRGPSQSQAINRRFSNLGVIMEIFRPQSIQFYRLDQRYWNAIPEVIIGTAPFATEGLLLDRAGIAEYRPSQGYHRHPAFQTRHGYVHLRDGRTALFTRTSELDGGVIVDGQVRYFFDASCSD